MFFNINKYYIESNFLNCILYKSSTDLVKSKEFFKQFPSMVLFTLLQKLWNNLPEFNFLREIFYNEKQSLCLYIMHK